MHGVHIAWYGMIELKRCAECHMTLNAVASVCPTCLSKNAEPFQAPSEGRVISWTTIRRAPAGYGTAAPYHVLVVELASDIRITGRLISESSPPTVGARVRSAGHESGCELFVVVQT